MDNKETTTNQESVNFSDKTSDESRINGKIRTIRFILLSTILYFITDAIGRWFVPAQDSVPSLFSILIWILCFITGAVQFYFWRRISLKWLKWAAAIVYIILMALLLRWRILSIWRLNTYRLQAISDHHAYLGIPHRGHIHIIPSLVRQPY